MNKIRRLIGLYFITIACIFLSGCDKLWEQNSTTNLEESMQEQDKSTVFSRMDNICETPTRVLYVINATVHYYNKLDGVAYTFCFDPLCKHNDACISQKFLKIDERQPIRYCEDNNRFYALRGKNLISFSFDGSDLQIIYTYGDSDWHEINYDNIILQYLEIYDGYAYFTIQDADTGVRHIYRYHLTERKLEMVLKCQQDIENIISMSLIGHNLYFWASNEERQILYQCDLNSKTLRIVTESIFPLDFFDGSKFYSAPFQEIQTATGVRYTTKEIVAFDTKSNSHFVLCKNDFAGTVRLLALTDRYLYYTVYDPLVIGYQARPFSSPTPVRNDQYYIIRYDLESGTHIEIFNNPNYNVFKIALLNDLVLIQGTVYEKVGDYVSGESKMFVADIDANGMFIDIRVLGE